MVRSIGLVGWMNFTSPPFSTMQCACSALRPSRTRRTTVAAVADEHLLLGPYEPFSGFKVAIIEEEGVPIELIETELTEDEIWGEPKANSVIYPEETVPLSAQEVIRS